MMKKQRQGEADNPGPWDEEVDADEEAMPALIQMEDSDVEYDWQEMQEDTNEDSDAEKTRKATIEGVWRPGPFGMVHDGGGRPLQEQESHANQGSQHDLHRATTEAGQDNGQHGDPVYQPPQAYNNTNYTP